MNVDDVFRSLSTSPPSRSPSLHPLSSLVLVLSLARARPPPTLPSPHARTCCLSSFCTGRLGLKFGMYGAMGYHQCCSGRSKSPLATDNLLEDADGLLRPSPSVQGEEVTSRCGSLLLLNVPTPLMTSSPSKAAPTPPRTTAAAQGATRARARTPIRRRAGTPRTSSKTPSSGRRGASISSSLMVAAAPSATLSRCAMLWRRPARELPPPSSPSLTHTFAF